MMNVVDKMCLDFSVYRDILPLYFLKQTSNVSFFFAFLRFQEKLVVIILSRLFVPFIVCTFVNVSHWDWVRLSLSMFADETKTMYFKDMFFSSKLKVIYSFFIFKLIWWHFCKSQISIFCLKHQPLLSAKKVFRDLNRFYQLTRHHLKDVSSFPNNWLHKMLLLQMKRKKKRRKRRKGKLL